MNNYAIEDVVAHKDPMILISRLQSHNSTSAICEVDISSESPFYQESIQGVNSYIGIEYMAQSIAALAGAKSLDNGGPIDIGFLLGSRKYQTFQSKFHLNRTYQIKVEELYQEESGLCVFQCEITDDGQVIALAKVNAFQPDNPDEFLKEQ